jgi:predicted MFS family arabinose efflux permease
VVLNRGASGAASLATAVGIGGFFALVAPLVGARRGHGRTFIASCLGSGLVLVLFGVQRSLVPAFVLVAMVAFLMMSAAVLCTMITQLTTPDELLGRVIGAQLLVVDFAFAVGTLLLGVAGSVFGVGTAMTVAGALLTLAAGFVFVRAPELRAVP